MSVLCRACMTLALKWLRVNKNCKQWLLYKIIEKRASYDVSVRTKD